MSTEIIDDPDFEQKIYTHKFDETKQCIHPEHKPPMHIYLPPGKMMIHTCPGCGKITKIKSNATWCIGE